MSWGTPATAVVGDPITAAFWNTNGRDNLLETAPAKVTTAGDIVYATGASALARLGIGGVGRVLGGGASAPAWTLFESCGLSNSGDQSINSGARTAVTWDTEEWDNAGLHSTSSNTSRVTVPTAGIYLCTAMILWATNNTTGERYIEIDVNAGGINRTHFPPVNATTNHAMVLSKQMKLVANDYVEVIVLQSSGGAVNVRGPDSMFQVTRIGVAT